MHEQAEGLRTVVAALCGLGRDFDAERIAEILWLAAQDDGSAAVGGAKIDGTGRRAGPATPAAADRPPTDSLASKADQPAPRSSLHTPWGDGVPGSGAVGVSLPRAGSLPRGRELARALKPLKRPWPRGRRQRLDITATVSDYVRVGELTPVFSDEPERWFDAIVVVDRSPTMAVWAGTADELVRLLARTGVFRTVRVHEPLRGPVTGEHPDPARPPGSARRGGRREIRTSPSAHVRLLRLGVGRVARRIAVEPASYVGRLRAHRPPQPVAVEDLAADGHEPARRARGLTREARRDQRTTAIRQNAPDGSRVSRDGRPGLAARPRELPVPPCGRPLGPHAHARGSRGLRGAAPARTGPGRADEGRGGERGRGRSAQRTVADGRLPVPRLSGGGPSGGAVLAVSAGERRPAPGRAAEPRAGGDHRRPGRVRRRRTGHRHRGRSGGRPPRAAVQGRHARAAHAPARHPGRPASGQRCGPVHREQLGLARPVLGRRVGRRDRHRDTGGSRALRRGVRRRPLRGGPPRGCGPAGRARGNL
ncbi:hypothetical protein SGRI78S_00929 [Streptomyces griseus subsp. griseus]